MPWLGIGLILQGVCRSAMTAIAILILMDMDHGKAQHVGAASGLYFSAGEIGGALGPMSIGVLADVIPRVAVYDDRRERGADASSGQAAPPDEALA